MLSPLSVFHKLNLFNWPENNICAADNIDSSAHNRLSGCLCYSGGYRQTLRSYPSGTISVLKFSFGKFVVGLLFGIKRFHRSLSHSAIDCFKYGSSTFLPFIYRLSPSYFTLSPGTPMTRLMKSLPSSGTWNTTTSPCFGSRIS